MLTRGILFESVAAPLLYKTTDLAEPLFGMPFKSRLHAMIIVLMDQQNPI